MKPGTVFYDGYTLAMAHASVGPGWARLVDELFQYLPAGTKVIQVKEKMGRFVVYLDKHTPEGSELVRRLHAASGSQCEGCNNPGTYRGGKRIRTYCDTCEATYQQTGIDPWL
jgi:hypothetical protein